MVGSTSYPVSISSLEFPTASLSLSQTLATLRRSTLSVTNRLRSIETDALFVQEVAQYYNLPLVANERCGSWYISPEKKAGSAYFKSTDGHAGQWDFSQRRLNLQLLSIAREHGGCIVVDSTRRGKLMPDALSKTVPIWCAVFNRALFPEKTEFHAVRFPPNVLGASEESQIENRIGDFVSSLKDLKLDLEGLRARVGKPMRLFWAWRNYFSPRSADDDCHTLVLCSASKRVEGAEMSEGGYIQGAGDDSESWSLGLTPSVFWENKTKIFSTKEEELPELIEELVQQSRAQISAEQATLIGPTRNIYIGKVRAAAEDRAGFDLVINCNGDTVPPEEENRKILNLSCGVRKLGSRDLRNVLDQVKDFVKRELESDPSRSLLVTCETGRDLSAGTILTVLCLFYNDNGKFVGLQPNSPVDKQFIRQRLAWIITSNHDVNPSRSTLQSVNSFLMQRPD